MSNKDWSFTRVYDEAKIAAYHKRIRSLTRPGIILTDREPANLALRGCLKEDHEFHLSEEPDRFSLVCCYCGRRMEMWKRLPLSLGYVLAAAARLDYGKNSEVTVRAAAASLNLSGRSARARRKKTYDLAITLLKLLRIKNARAPGDEIIGSKKLNTLVNLAMWPDELKKMPRSTMKPYKFVIDAVMLMEGRLS